MIPESPDQGLNRCPSENVLREDVVPSHNPSVRTDADILREKVKRTGGNVFKLAWDMVFKKLPPFKQQEILRFTKEKEKNIDNRFYTEFVQQVSSLVDEV